MNSNRVIDMRHFMVVGRVGELFGLAVELVQLLKDESSGFHGQDFFSNALGADFFSNYYDDSQDIGPRP
jgi:hypothetical protein